MSPLLGCIPCTNVLGDLWVLLWGFEKTFCWSATKPFLQGGQLKRLAALGESLIGTPRTLNTLPPQTPMNQVRCGQNQILQEFLMKFPFFNGIYFLKVHMHTTSSVLKFYEVLFVGNY